MMMDLERVRKFYPQHRWSFPFDIVEVHNTYFDEGECPNYRFQRKD